MPWNAISNRWKERWKERYQFNKSDIEVTLTAVEALRWDTVVPDEHIQVSDSKGWVTSHGIERCRNNHFLLAS